MKHTFQVKTLYYKFPLDIDWSIRYHLVFKDRKRYENRWILKSHFDKDYVRLRKWEAMDYIERFNSKPKLILGFDLYDTYRKVEITDRAELRFYIDMDDLPGEVIDELPKEGE
jgi:hypothetical protein